MIGCKGLGNVGIQALNFFAENEDTRTIPVILLVPAEMQKHLSHAQLSDIHVPIGLPLKFIRVRKALKVLIKAGKKLHAAEEAKR